MSFRVRLAVFFELIVVVPMVVVAALIVGISNTSRSAKADARLDGGVRPRSPSTGATWVRPGAPLG